jgi:hypothetical protein
LPGMGWLAAWACRGWADLPLGLARDGRFSRLIGVGIAVSALAEVRRLGGAAESDQGVDGVGAGAPDLAVADEGGGAVEDQAVLRGSGDE